MGEIGSTHSSENLRRSPIGRIVVDGISEQRTADQHQRAFGVREHVRQPIEVLRARTRQHARARLIHLGVGLRVEQILRQDDRDGAGRAALGDMEGTRDRLGGLLGFDHLDHQFRHVGQQAGIVLLLQRHAAEVLAFDLAHQHYQWGRIVIGGVDRHHGVGQAGTARDDAATGAAAQAAIGDRHVAGATFMAAHDQSQRVHVGERVDQPDIALAGNAEHLVDVMRFQALGEQAGNGTGHCGDVSCGSGRVDEARGFKRFFHEDR